MPNSESFTRVYILSGDAATGFSVANSGNTFTNSLSDTADGNQNGSTEIGQLLFWSAAGSSTLLGFSAAGDPVIRAPSGSNYVLSNGSLPLGDIGFTTDGGPYAYCFAPGTGIATPSGEVAVERLAIGDPILTADGREVPVRWIGRQSVSTMFAGERARPVRIAAGALGDGLPHYDLTVTADHGMILDGLVINAGALVNGSTITLVPLAELPARVTYYHVETEDHDVILANGAAAETFIDYAGRAAFDNHAEYLALYGAEPMIAELPLPRISAARQLPAAIRARLMPASAA
jgi:hypothetical protein